METTGLLCNTQQCITAPIWLNSPVNFKITFASTQTGSMGPPVVRISNRCITEQYNTLF